MKNCDWIDREGRCDGFLWKECNYCGAIDNEPCLNVKKQILKGKRVMGLLSYNELVKLVDDGVIEVDPQNINGASIDITLDDIIRVEDEPKFNNVVDLMNKESIETRPIALTEYGYQMMPGEFILASSREVFNLPDNIVAEYVLKSTLARNGLNHLLAGYADPWWSNSKLTLELHNVLSKHRLTIKPGMKIGQIKFYRVEPVPEHAGYGINGQYNNQNGVTPSNGLR